MRHDALVAIGLFGAIVAVAALVNRFRPNQRTQVRRIVLLFLLYVAALSAHHALAAVDAQVWSSRMLVGAHLLQAFTVVNLTATSIFSVLLPVAGVVLPMIATDLLVGVGYVAATLVVLATHGLNPTSAFASAAVVSAVLAISLQSTLGNILGGVALQLDGSVHEGDWVQLDNGTQGRVRAIRWRHTVLQTRDWSTIIVPNAQLLASSITLLGKRDGRRVPQRNWIWFNVDFRYAPTRVIRVVEQALRAAPIPNVAAEPKMRCVCMDFAKSGGESFASYAVHYWCNDMGRVDPTSSRVRARIFTALRRAGIPLALPASTTWVDLVNDERAERKRSQRTAERFEAIRRVALFRSLTDEELHALARGMSHVIYTAGEICTHQGTTADFLYVLTSGAVEIRTRSEAGPDGARGARVVAVLEAPDVFGEMALMTGAPRMADVVARTDVDCFRLDKATFERVLLSRPEIADELSDKLAQRSVELSDIRDGLDDKAKRAREVKERDQILDAIRSFFSM